MQGHILIVEDEREMAELISLYLERDGFQTTICFSAEEALKQISNSSFDAVVLDINLPGMDGFDFLHTMRKDYILPVVIVSARETDEDMILGLGIGADEYVTKPFSPKVLSARIRAMLRRIRMDASDSLEHHFGVYTLDENAAVLKKGSDIIRLSAKEFDVLAFLVTNAGKTYTPETLYEAVWGNQYGDVSAVAVYMQRLRKKIEDDPHEPTFIQTIHGKGYRFNPDILQ